MIVTPDPSADEAAALAATDLTVSLGGRALLHGITLRIGQAEHVALIGASGSGKSLTAAAVLGTLPRQARVGGRVVVGGHDVTTRPPSQRPAAARVAAVGQDPTAALNPLVAIGVQLALPLRAHRGLRGGALTHAGEDLLSAVGLEDPARVMRSTAGELSGGQRQRVCIAMALASPAGLLVADEPTTALDLVTQAQVVGLLREATRDTGMLFITHDVAVAASLCDRAVVLHEGRVVEDAPVSQLIAHPQHEHTRALVRAAHAGALPGTTRRAPAPLGAAP